MFLSDETASELLSLAGVALTYDDVSEALDAICVIAARTVENAEGVSVTSVSGAGPPVVAASSRWAGQLDEMQYTEHEGPCLDAARTGALFRVPDTATEPRWPSYMPRAMKAGAMSMVSIPMTVEAKTVGALNVYAKEAGAFDASAVSIAEVIAAHASLATQVSVAMYGHRALAEQLHEAMASRAVIEQAKGLIMGATGCDADTAFQRLVEQSQHENIKLRDLAAELIERSKR